MQRVFGDLDALRYVDGGHDAERRAAFAHHLADHPAEAERVERWGRQNAALRAAFADVLQETVPVNLRPHTPVVLPSSSATPAHPAVRPAATVHALPPIGGAKPPCRDIAATTGPTTPGHLSRKAKVAIAILTAVLVAGLALILVDGPTPKGRSHVTGSAEATVAAVTAHAYDAYQTYAADPSRPVEFKLPEMPAFDQWAQQRLGVAISPADFRYEGWTLLGARLVPGPMSPAALYIYEDKAGERLSLFISPTVPLSGEGSIVLGSGVNGGSFATWSRNGLAYVVTVARSADWLSRHAETLRRMAGGTGP